MIEMSKMITLRKEIFDMSKKGYSRPGLFGTMNHYDN